MACFQGNKEGQVPSAWAMISKLLPGIPSQAPHLPTALSVEILLGRRLTKFAHTMLPVLWNLVHLQSTGFAVPSEARMHKFLEKICFIYWSGYVFIDCSSTRLALKVTLGVSRSRSSSVLLPDQLFSCIFSFGAFCKRCIHCIFIETLCLEWFLFGIL